MSDSPITLALFSAPILFFLLGFFGAVLKSDLEFPHNFGKALSMFLILAIGLKGGLALAHNELTWVILAGIGLSIVLSLSLPFLAFGILRKFVGTNIPDSIAIAACYGSTSLVTFVTAQTLLDRQGIPYEPYFIVFLTFMESPALLTASALKRRFMKDHTGTRHPSNWEWRHVFLGGSNLLLLGSFAIGYFSGAEGLAGVKPFFLEPFQGALALFLLEMGLMAGGQLGDFLKAGWRLTLFGLLMPLVGGVLGLICAKILGFSVGGQVLFAVLGASASYIVVPAAMRLSLPEANPGVYVPLALAVTFPVNLIFGIPIYLWLSHVLNFSTP